VGFVYKYALKGYAARIYAQRLSALARDPQVLFIVTLVVSRLTPPPLLEVQEMVEELRSPAGELPAEAVH